ncbi:hypothetical protein [Vibrio splendidus]|uniref:hypothetical protein n=1 Tax=Vibrio splendidus TaxID=29497 RepID=UPI0024691E8D|nr:hypothetical protein [Vibrio splendidus]MDH5933774.1 hypothetical protein [Vibrio splendidus]
MISRKLLLASIAIWHGEQLIYCGMSGRQIEKNSHKPKFGLITRIQSHASGRLSVDQFFGYIANCLVIPSLKPSEPPRFASGDLKLDSLTKEYIHQHLEFQYVVVDTSEGAYKQEDKARSGEILGQLPLLNPL